MRSQRVLSQDEVAHIIAAAFSYNELNVSDLAFDLSDGTLRVIATVEDEPLKVREVPEQNAYGMDTMSASILDRMQRNRASGN